jgi:hypothetical protein
LDGRVQAAEENWRKEATRALHEHPDYGDFSERVEAARQRVQEAADELHEAQERAAEMLQANLPEPPELPQATPRLKPKPALFDSATDFVTTTQRLIADKKLAGQTNPHEDEAEDHD